MPVCVHIITIHAAASESVARRKNNIPFSRPRTELIFILCRAATATVISPPDEMSRECTPHSHWRMAGNKKFSYFASLKNGVCVCCSVARSRNKHLNAAVLNDIPDAALSHYYIDLNFIFLLVATRFFL
jgi:hypothetical protein